MENQSGFYRSATNKVIAGVCGGLGMRFHIDPVLIRLLFVFMVLAGGSGVLVYIILWIVMPKRYDDPVVNANQSQDSSDTEFIRRDLKEATPTYRNGQIFLGIALILIGGLFLTAIFIPGFNTNDWWPLILIVGGIFVLLTPSSHK